MGKKKAMKRMVAGLTALTFVAGSLPANEGAFWKGNVAIVANAAGDVAWQDGDINDDAVIDGNVTLKSGCSYTIHGVVVINGNLTLEPSRYEPMVDWEYNEETDEWYEVEREGSTYYTSLYLDEGALLIINGDLYLEGESSINGHNCPGAFVTGQIHENGGTYYDWETFTTSLTNIVYEGIKDDGDRWFSSEGSTYKLDGSNFKLMYEKHPGQKVYCETDGYGDYWTDGDGKSYANMFGTEEVALDNLTIPATGHNYSEPVWTWEEDPVSDTDSVSYAASARFTCENCSNEQIVDASVTVDNFPENCKTVYNAKAVFNGREYTDTKTITEPGAVYTASELKNAANKGGKIILGSDIDLTDWFYFKNCDLDLHGHTITSSSYFGVSNATLTIRDSIGKGKVSFTSGRAITTPGTLILESGTIESTSPNGCIDAYAGTFIMNGGIISGIQGVRYDASVTINGGMINGGINDAEGSVTITGGKFSFDPSHYLGEGSFAVQDNDCWKVITYKKVDAREATCTEAGSNAYWIDETGTEPIYLSYDGINYSEIEENSWIIPATGHKFTPAASKWDSEGNLTVTFACTNAECNETKNVTVPAQQIALLLGMRDQVASQWVWSADYSTASLVLKEFPETALAAITDSDLKAYIAVNGVTVPAVVSSRKKTDATCEEASVIIYTAAIAAGADMITDIQSVKDGEALGHKFVSSAPVMNEDGSMSVTFTCSECGETKTASLTAQEITGILAMSDSFTKTWKWSDDNKSASVTLTNMSETIFKAISDKDLSDFISANGITLPAAVTVSETEAGCEEDGVITYTATVAAGAKAITEEKTFAGEKATGHSWGSPVPDMNTDGSMTVTFTCANCRETKKATVTAEQMQGLFAFADQVEKNWNWSDDSKSATLTLTSIPETALAAITDADLKAFIAEYGVTVPAAVSANKLTATCDKDGSTIYTAVVAAGTTVIKETKTVSGDKATGHAWGNPVPKVNTDGSLTVTFTCANCRETKTATVTAEQMQGLLASADKFTKNWKWSDDNKSATLTLTNIPEAALALVTDEDLKTFITEYGVTVPAVVTGPVNGVYTAVIKAGDIVISDTKEDPNYVPVTEPAITTEAAKETTPAAATTVTEATTEAIKETTVAVTTTVTEATTAKVTEATTAGATTPVTTVGTTPAVTTTVTESTTAKVTEATTAGVTVPVTTIGTTAAVTTEAVKETTPAATTTVTEATTAKVTEATTVGVTTPITTAGTTAAVTTEAAKETTPAATTTVTEATTAKVTEATTAGVTTPVTTAGTTAAVTTEAVKETTSAAATTVTEATTVKVTEATTAGVTVPVTTIGTTAAAKETTPAAATTVTEATTVKVTEATTAGVTVPVTTIGTTAAVTTEAAKETTPAAVTTVTEATTAKVTEATTAGVTTPVTTAGTTAAVTTEAAKETTLAATTTVTEATTAKVTEATTAGVTTPVTTVGTTPAAVTTEAVKETIPAAATTVTEATTAGVTTPVTTVGTTPAVTTEAVKETTPAVTTEAVKETTPTVTTEAAKETTPAVTTTVTEETTPEVTTTVTEAVTEPVVTEAKKPLFKPVRVEIPAEVKTIAATVNEEKNSVEVKLTPEDVKADEWLSVKAADKTTVSFDGNATKVLADLIEKAGGENVALDVSFEPDLTKLDPDIAEKAAEAMEKGAIVLDFNFVDTSTNEPIPFNTNGSGKIVIDIPVAPEQLTSLGDPENLVVVYVDEDGNLEYMDTWYDTETGTIRFAASHFSTFMVIEDERPAEADVKESEWVASFGQFDEWVQKDYTDRNKGADIVTKAETTDNGLIKVTVEDKNGEVLDVYSINPETGNAVTQDGGIVNLPQTGVTTRKYAAIAGSALLSVVSGLWMVMKSFRRKKEDEE